MFVKKFLALIFLLLYLIDVVFPASSFFFFWSTSFHKKEFRSYWFSFGNFSINLFSTRIGTFLCLSFPIKLVPFSIRLFNSTVVSKVSLFLLLLCAYSIRKWMSVFFKLLLPIHLLKNVLKILSLFLILKLHVCSSKLFGLIPQQSRGRQFSFVFIG